MATKLLRFPRWAEVLRNSSAPENIKKNHEIILRWYLGWCRKCAVGCSVDSARAFVKWAQKEKGADDLQVERWKEAIQWFFLEGKKQILSAANRDDVAKKRESRRQFAPKGQVGRSENSEERLVAFSAEEGQILDLMRRRGMALRTERSYIRWYRDFLRQSGLSSGAQINASALKSYLSYLAMERATASSTQKVAL